MIKKVGNNIDVHSKKSLARITVASHMKKDKSHTLRKESVHKLDADSFKFNTFLFILESTFIN